jgi:CNT family concentrative nucleoside transporter
MLPETEQSVTAGHATVNFNSETRNVLDAATAGASQGMALAINVLAMLIAFIALIAILDLGLGHVGHWWMGFGDPVATQPATAPLSLGMLLGWVFAPVAWIIGAPPNELETFGSLLGTAMATNEMVAYERLSKWVLQGEISERSTLLAMYSLCGFANISSIGIQIAGIGSLAPERRPDLVSLAPRAMLGGAMASWMTGTVAGMLLG